MSNSSPESWATDDADNPGSPTQLAAVKDEVVRRWGTLDLLDVLKDADFLAEVTTE